MTSILRRTLVALAFTSTVCLVATPTMADDVNTCEKACQLVKDNGAYRLRFDFNGKRIVCDSLPISVGKGDVISVP